MFLDCFTKTIETLLRDCLLIGSVIAQEFPLLHFTVACSPRGLHCKRHRRGLEDLPIYVVGEPGPKAVIVLPEVFGCHHTTITVIIIIHPHPHLITITTQQKRRQGTVNSKDGRKDTHAPKSA